MKMKRIKKSLSLILCIVLIVVMALFTTGCNDNENKENAATTEVATTAAEEGSIVKGEGNTQFMFTVVDKDGNETEFEIHTDKKTVGEALLELDLIAGEEGDYGLFVKEVNGITADYETDGTYWAFYVNDEYATAGVDATEIKEGDSYSFKVEK